MLKDHRRIEYAFEILKMYHKNPGEYESKEIYKIVVADNPSLSMSYISKVLQMMTRAGILQSSNAGYCLTQPVEEITMDRILDICDMPDEFSPIYGLCKKIKDSVSLVTVTEFCGL